MKLRLTIQTTFFTILLMGILTGGAFAGDAEEGRIKADTCLGCHAVPSYTTVYPTYHVPKLSGQYKEYIIAALQAYKSGLRKHKTMQAHASRLSDEDIADIAAYFSSQEAAEPHEPMPSAANVPQAETCAVCHGPDGNGIAPDFPKIGGQYRDYLYNSLRQYVSGERDNPIMLGIVSTISDEDMKVLAEYYSRQDGLGTLKTRKFLQRQSAAK